MSTPSPSKRARAAQAPSAAASPFNFHSAHMAARPTPPLPPAMSSLAAFSAMSPADSFSPFNHPASMLGSGAGLTTAFGTPYAGGSAAASPITTALFHGSRVLSNIQPSDNLSSTSGLKDTASGSVVPQQGSPQHLRLALQHLQESLLTTLEAEAESYFDAVDSALMAQSDSRAVHHKAQMLDMALANVLTHLEKQGLAYIPLLPLPAVAPAPDEPAIGEAISEQPPPNGTAADTNVAQGTSSDLTQRSHVLQQQAKQLYGRRQRLKESAGIVAGILSD